MARLTVTRGFLLNAEDLKEGKLHDSCFPGLSAVQVSVGVQSPNYAYIWKSVEFRLGSSWKKCSKTSRAPKSQAALTDLFISNLNKIKINTYYDQPFLWLV